MPYFSVMLHGDGINIPSENGREAIIGFYTTRLVKAKTPYEAENKAKEMILKEWSSSPYCLANKGSSPKLSIKTITNKTFIDRFRVKNKGYSFYCREE